MPLRQASPDAILLFDGVFLLRPELFACWDFKVFLDIDFEVMIARAIRRDGGGSGTVESVRERNRLRYVPGQQIYLQDCRPREQADIVVENNNFNAPLLTSHADGD